MNLSMNNLTINLSICKLIVK